MAKTLQLLFAALLVLVGTSQALISFHSNLTVPVEAYTGATFYNGAIYITATLDFPSPTQHIYIVGTTGDRLSLTTDITAPLAQNNQLFRPTPDQLGNLLYFNGRYKSRNSLFSMNLANPRATPKKIDFPTLQWDIAVNPTRREAYIFGLSNLMYVVDLTAFTIKRTVPLVFDTRIQLLDPTVNRVDGFLYALLVVPIGGHPCNTTTSIVMINTDNGQLVPFWSSVTPSGLAGRSLAFHPTLPSVVYVGFAEPLGTTTCTFATQIGRFAANEKPRYSEVYTSHQSRGSIDLWTDFQGGALYSVLDADGIVRFHDANNLIAKQTFEIPRNVAPRSIHPEVMGSDRFLYLISNSDNIIALSK